MGQAEGLGGEGAGGECGCVDEIRHEGSAVVAVVGSGEQCGCERSEGQEEGPGLSWIQSPPGQDLN